jgi:hypothetical protein
MFSGRKMVFVVALIALWSTATAQSAPRKKAAAEAKPRASTPLNS